MAIDTKVKVGVVQATPVLFDIQKTVEKVIEWIQKAKAENCKLLPRSIYSDLPSWAVL